VIDSRAEAAQYYDLQSFPHDIPFYQTCIPSPEAHILELGCGTGRVLLSLVNHCRSIQGLDKSAAMLSICQEKLQKAGIPAAKASVACSDITNYELRRTFDLIIAPFRVFQNLESDEEVAGFFGCVRKHLAPRGSCILNVFRPYLDPDTLRREWCNPAENFRWEKPFVGGRLLHYDKRTRMDKEKLILYPELVYRQYVDDVCTKETVLKIVMRCYYPEQFTQLIVDHGFHILQRWGGYAGERYGEGPELVIQFAAEC
jgi:SAM-dependent methyltransferase